MLWVRLGLQVVGGGGARKRDSAGEPEELDADGDQGKGHISAIDAHLRGLNAPGLGSDVRRVRVVPVLGLGYGRAAGR